MSRRGVVPILLVLFALQPVPLDAQRRRQPPTPTQGGRGFFMIGAQQFDLDALNGRLSRAGLPTRDDVLLTLGGGGFFYRNRLVLGGEGHAVLSSAESTGAFRSTLAGGYGLFNVGYAVVARRGLLVYPLVGFGGGGLVVDIEERSAPTFDDVLGQPRRGSELVQSQLVLAAAIGADRVFARSNGRGGIAVGFRAGWTFAPDDGEWSLGRNDVANGPGGGLTGPFLRVSIGGGSR